MLKVTPQNILFTSFVTFGALMALSAFFAIPSTAALLAYCVQSYLDKNKDQELSSIKERLSQLEKRVAFGGIGKGV
jgi:hypothetical protein